MSAGADAVTAAAAKEDVMKTKTPSNGRAAAGSAFLNLRSVIGAPVSALGLFPLGDDERHKARYLQLLWSQGPFLHRLELEISSSSEEEGGGNIDGGNQGESTTPCAEKRQTVRVFNDDDRFSSSLNISSQLRQPHGRRRQRRSSSRTGQEPPSRDRYNGYGKNSATQLELDQIAESEASHSLGDSQQSSTLLATPSCVSTNIHGIRLCKSARLSSSFHPNQINKERPRKVTTRTVYEPNSAAHDGDVFLVWGGQRVSMLVLLLANKTRSTTSDGCSKDKSESGSTKGETETLLLPLKFRNCSESKEKEGESATVLTAGPSVGPGTNNGEKSSSSAHINDKKQPLYCCSLEVDDWILDCHLEFDKTGPCDDDIAAGVGEEEKHQDTRRSSSSPSWATLIVGTAHDCLHFARIRLTLEEADRMGGANSALVAHVFSSFRVQGLPSSIGHSLAVCHAMHMVAFGSASHDIVLWRYNISSSSGAASPALATLRGHKGVVHSIRFDLEGRRMATASEDRSIRLWTRQQRGDQQGVAEPGDCESEWTCAWTSWGHSARCWHASFHFARRTGNDLEVVVSTGEDGTARLWSADTGRCVGIVRRGRNAAAPLWSADSCASVLVVAANNGSLTLHDLTSILESCDHYDVGGIKEDDVGSLLISLPSPPQVVTGLAFSSSQSAPLLLVATRSGELFQFDGTSTITTTTLRPWKSLERATADAEMTCMAIRPGDRQAAIGTKLGSIMLVPLELAQQPLFAEETSENICLSQSVLRRAVKRLEWLTESVLLSCHVDCLAWWRLSGNRAQCQGIVLQPRTSGMPNCADWNPSTQRLIVGDTRGSLALFDLSSVLLSRSTDSDSLSVVDSISILPRVHGKEHVTDVRWASCHLVLSVGYDGCVCECAVSEHGRVLKLVSLSMAPFFGLERIWSIGGPSSSVVGGYHGNTFALKHLESGYEFARIETGGRQRSYCLQMPRTLPAAGPQSLNFAFSETRKSGGHYIHLYRRRVFCRVVSLPHSMAPFPPWDLGVGLHDETIYGVDLLRFGDSLPASFVVVTASQDCHARVSLLGSDGSFVLSKQLPSQVSSVRAVCISSGDASYPILQSLIAVGGCRLTLQLFQLHRGIHAGEIRVELLGVGKIQAKVSSIDQRINAVSAIHLDEDRGHIVVSGDSNGDSYLYRSSEIDRGAVYGRMLFRSDRPILSVKLTRVGRSLILLAGTSGGTLVLYDVTDLTVSDDAGGCRKVFECKPHSVGTNALDARPCNCLEGIVLRICTGGDDQAIHCCDLLLGQGATSSAKLLRSATLMNACASAIRGVSWLDERRLCAASYDQQLVVLDAQYPKLRPIARTPLPVGDINALACHTTSDATAPSTIAVAGAGVAVYSVWQNPSSWNTLY